MISAPLIEYLKKGIFTLLGAMLAVYLFVILLTYTGNDPSWSHISSDMTTISNTGGAMGAWLSDVLYSFFGFGAWWLIAFLVYESIWLWWGNKSTYWLIRVAAYIFLLLSGSALITQLMTLFQLSPDWALIRPSGALGGIAGLELQLRLAAMLSPWGCALFLTLFMLITATFAFNIHWRKLYQKMTSAAWLGTGVKDPSAAKPAFAKANLDPQRQSQSEMSKPHQDKKKTKVLNDDHALSLEPAFEGAGSSSSIKHTLSDFLATSGLVASVKAAVAADSPRPPVEQSKATADKTNEASKKNDSKINTFNSADTGADSAVADTRVIDKDVIDKSSSKSPQLSPKEPLSSASPAASGAANFIQRAFAAKNSDPKPSATKVEPSFAWNDSGMVEDLLAETAHFKAPETSEAPEANEPRPSSRFMYSIVDSDSEAFSSTTDEPITANQESFNDDFILPMTVSPALEDKEEDSQFDHSSQDALSADLITEDLMQLAMGSYFMAPDDGNDQADAETIAAEPAVSAFEPQDDDWQGSEGLNDDIYTDSDSFADIETLEVGLEALEASLDNSAAKVSKVAPIIEVTSAAPAELPKGRDDVDNIDDVPSISFAIPDWQANNAIPEMVVDEPSFPDIHNDAAFATKSRAMQTASYRAQLTPVPALDILDKPDPNQEPSYSALELEQLSELLEIKLQEFNVKAEVVTAIPGPVVTRFEVELAAGVKASKVTGISRDLARSLSMASLRVVEVIPGKPYIGIEVPNKQREMVRLIELLHTKAYQDSNSHISMAMGKDISGKPIITDLTRAPHMLVAGTTGSGKSVLVNAMLLSMLLKYTPDELRLILIDPKQLELANYNDIPHLLTPVVTDMTEAASSLSWCVAEMERRYTLMSLLKVRKLNEFNKKVLAAEKLGQPLIDPLWRPNDSVSMDKAPKLKTLPLIVIVADEFADMIMQVGKQAEELITRLAQKSRAAGIHLMLATQRPSVDVITGLIKANIPVRAALRVNSKVDSRTILDSGGAEDMLGNGDMLFLGPGQIEPERVHGAYVSDEEVNRVCDAWRDRGAPDYIDDMSGNFELTAPSGGASGASGEDDDLYNDAVAFVMETRKVSASSIQRKFSIGYNRAARIVDSMEDAGLVSSMGKSGKRELLM